jgi:hypothetical protein
MNQINSLEQFSTVLTDILTRLRNLGDVALPCPSPQPWNSAEFCARFEADRGGRSIVPDWRFQAYPRFDRLSDAPVMRFASLHVSVNISDATMGGKTAHRVVNSLDELNVALSELMAFRDEKLKACKHMNHSFVANLGRCYNRYKCNDCGVTFEIDSGD